MAPVQILSNWVFSEQSEDWPCQCCDAPRAMDHEDGYWICDNQHKTWRVLEGPFQPIMPHSPEQCCGGCDFHPLINEDIIQMIHSEITGLLWGDLLMQYELQILASETDEEREMKEAIEKAAKAAKLLSMRAAEMERYARLKAQTNLVLEKTDRGKVSRIRKIAEPCKWLYLDEKAPKHEWRRNRTGKDEPPYRPYLTGAQCWAWEYTDPRTNKKVIKHTCDHLHPGEDDWLDEWSKDRHYRPTDSSVRDFRSLAAPTPRSSELSTASYSTPIRASDPHPRIVPNAPSRPSGARGKKNSRVSFLDFDEIDC